MLDTLSAYPPPQEPPNVEDNLPGDALLTIGLSVDPTTETVTLVSVNGQTGSEIELERYLDSNDLKFAGGTQVFDRDSNPQTLTIDVILTNRRDYGFENFTLAASPLYETSTSATFKAVQSMLYDVNNDGAFDAATEQMYQRPDSFTTQVVDPVVSFPNSGFMEPVGGTDTKLIAPLRVAFTPGERFSLYIVVDADEVVPNPELDPNTETLVATIDGGNGTSAPVVVADAPGYAVFNAHGSSGTGLRFDWDFGDGQTSQESYVSHLYQNPGTYTATLTITNSVGRTATTSQSVVVVPSLETAVQGLNEYRYLDLQDSSDRTLNIDIGSTPPSGFEYFWDFGDGNTGTGSNISHTYASLGTYTLTFTIREVATTQAQSSSSITTASNDGVLWRDETWFTISADAPEARFTTSNPRTTDPNDKDEGPYYGSLPLTLDFDASSSTSLTSGSLTYTWDFGDGSAPQQGEQVSYEYTQEGLFPVTLTVTDDATGLTDTWRSFARPHLTKNIGDVEVRYETRFSIGYPNGSSQIGTQSIELAQAENSGTSIINEYSPYVYYIDDTVTSGGFIFDHGFFDCEKSDANNDLRYQITVNGGGNLAASDPGAIFYGKRTETIDDPNGIPVTYYFCDQVIIFGSNVDPALTNELRRDVRPNSQVYIATPIQTLTYHYDAIAGLRVPRVYVSVVPDSLVPGEVASPYIQEYIADTPNGDEFMMVARVRSRDIVNGSVDLDIPVYAVDGNGNHAAEANGYFHARFVDETSDCDDCVMVDGKSTIRVSIPIGTTGTAPVPIDLSRIELSRDGTCTNLTERALGVTTRGCVTVATSHAVPGAAPVLPEFSTSLPLAAVLSGNAIRLGVSEAQIDQIWRDTEQELYANMDRALDDLVPFWDGGSEIFVQIRNGTLGDDKWAVGFAVLSILLDGAPVVGDGVDKGIDLIREVRQGSRRANELTGRGGYFEDAIDATLEQATTTRRDAADLAQDVVTRNELALAYANKACDQCDDPAVIRRFIGKAEQAIDRISGTGRDPDEAAQALIESLENYSPGTAEEFLDNLNSATPERAVGIVQEYSCRVIGLTTQVFKLKGCSRTLGDSLKNAPTDPILNPELEEGFKYQAHHLIPSQLAAEGGPANRPNPLVVRGQIDIAWDINSADNGIFLPSGRQDGAKYRETGNRHPDLPQHNGSHRQYTEQVETLLNQRWDSLVDQYQEYYPSLNLDEFGTSTNKLPDNPEIPLPAGVPTLQEAIEAELNNVVATLRGEVKTLGNTKTVNQIVLTTN